MEKKNIGLLTFHCATNYGGVIQAYALSKLLTSWGYYVEFINLRPENISNDRPKRIIDLFFRIVFNHFEKRYFPKLPSKINSYNELKKLNERFDIFIVGSDQVWNPELTKNYSLNYFFDFVDNDKIKISYAASFGSHELIMSDEQIEQISYLLKRFKFISVRENSGKDLCFNKFAVDAETVLDPTLLLSDYSDLVKNITPSNEDIICIKFIKSKEFISIANYVGKALNCKVKLLNSPKRYPGIRNIYFPKVNKWMDYIFNAKFVITDSFHGLCFCLIFNKEFIVVPGKIGRFTRLQNLLEMLGLENRIFNSLEELSKNNDFWRKPIEYNIVNEKMAFLRQKSLDALKGALNTDN